MSKILRLLDLSFEAWATLDHAFHERLAGDLYEAIEDVRNENNTSQMEAFDEALEWAASWITGAQLLGRSEEIQEYASNMAMSIRAAKRGLTKRVPDLWDSAPSQSFSTLKANPLAEHLSTPPTSG